MPIDSAWANEFAAEWVEAWNAHDVDRVLKLFTDDFEMTSPLIIRLMHEPSGTLEGKAAVGDYWRTGLAASPSLKFELIDVLIGVNSLAISFWRAPGKAAVEVLFFNQELLVVKGVAHHTQ